MPTERLAPREHGGWAVLLSAWLAGVLLAQRVDWAPLVFLSALFVARQLVQSTLKRHSCRRSAVRLAGCMLVGGTAAFFVARQIPIQLMFALGAIVLASFVLMLFKRERSLPSMMLGVALLSAAGPLAMGGTQMAPLVLFWFWLFAHFGSAALLIVWTIQKQKIQLAGGLLLAGFGAALCTALNLMSLAFAYGIPLIVLAVSGGSRRRGWIRRLGWAEAVGSMVFVACLVKAWSL